jgi:hypothetical protein
LQQGDRLFAPVVDSTITTPYGELTIKAGSLVFVTTAGATTAIYNLCDQSKGAVTLELSSGTIVIPPGRAIILSTDRSIDLNRSNPISSIALRNVQPSTTGGARTITAEFSVASALSQVGSLSALLKSKDPQHKRLARQLLKTAAILSVVNKNGAFYRPIR